MRTFSARETAWLQELDGIELASFWRRALAFLLDFAIVLLIFVSLVVASTLAYVGYGRLRGRETPAVNIQIKPDKMTFKANDGTELARTSDEVARILYDIVMPILYFGLFNWRTQGRSPGKALFRIRIVSIVHRHLTFWHSIERALGYGAAALEGGFGFVQFFIHPYRRCAQDRLAETIVVTERSYQAMLARPWPPTAVAEPTTPTEALPAAPAPLPSEAAPAESELQSD
jgi:uncharacterized RDD family membrane protein YckC